jgi:hypothetical protein
MIRRSAVLAALCCVSALLSFGQQSSLSGLVADPTGAVVPGATVTLESQDRGGSREAKTDSAGAYSFPQVQPGNYRLLVKSQGFNDVIVNNIRLLVSTPSTVNVTFERVGSVSETVSVESEAVQVNTTDASLGNAIGEKSILQLPFEGRNVVGLLAVQPGVTFIGEPNAGENPDYRSGAVNGGKSDQANVTLDGVDVNDSQRRTAFTSVLRVTLDSVQEFRTTTTNAGAEQGRSSGAQVALITKSGTNIFHGSAYAFNRNTAFTANDFFNNRQGLPRRALIRNVYGASVGGPIKRNTLFFFANYEARKDRSEETSAPRIVPDENFRQGFFDYFRTDGSIATLTPAEVRAQDPAGIGASPAVLQYFQSFPMPNCTDTGDLLNTSCFRFNFKTPLNWATYITKFDWNITQTQQAFIRGNLQNDNYARGLPNFPGDPPSSVFLENSKGLAAGYTNTLSPSLVWNVRYGLTRLGAENTGVQNAPAATFRDITNRFALTRGTSRIIPTHTIASDMTWTKGRHTLQFGGSFFFTRTSILSTQNSFSTAFSNSSWLSGTGAAFQVPGSRTSTPYRRQFTNLLGILSQLTRQANYDLTGATLAEGNPIPRKYGLDQYEMYVQDSWKITRALTLTAGLRYSINPPVWETQGYQTSSSIPLGDWFNTRGGLAQQGQSQAGAGVISYDLSNGPNGRPLYQQFENWQPRVALAYSPQSTSGLARFLFGEPGATSIRAGWGLYYDIIGQGLITLQDATALGFSSSISNPANAQAATAPRFTGFFNVPTSALPSAPPGGFPQRQPDIFQITNGVDDTIKAPYTMNMNFSIGREFKGGFFVQGSYVGRLSRRSLIRDDLAMPTNLIDPRSGQTYFEAARLLSQLAINEAPTSSVPRIPFWENLWPGLAGNGLTATQAAYREYVAAAPDFTTALANLDAFCSGASCSSLGPNALFNSQYSSLAALRSRGHGSYHAMQWTVRKRFTQGYLFDFNYTWSKAIDLASNTEIGYNGTTNTSNIAGQIRNAWDPFLQKGVADYDTTHLFSFQGVAELPFGKGKRFVGDAGRAMQALVGGWQLSALWRMSTGFPWSALNDGGWPTNWNVLSFANQIGPVPAQGRYKDSPSANGTGTFPSPFRQPGVALNAYGFSLPGDAGQRNGLRGDGVFTIDVGLGKRFDLFSVKDQMHTLQFRAEVFNLTNTVRFDTASINTGITNAATFGLYTQMLNRPRVMQLALRYEF